MRIGELRRLLDGSPDNHAGTAAARRRRRGAHRAGGRRSRRAGSVDCPATAARSAPSSRTWSRRRRRPSTCRPARTARGRASTTSTRTTRPPGRSIASPPRPSTRPCPATTSRSPSSRSSTSLPAFRRFGSRLAGGAYVEGWALYAERLAARWASTDDPRERFGALESRGLARRTAGRRHGHPRPGLDAPAVHRPAARTGRPVAPGGRDGDRPLHQLAGPGPLLHDRPARDPGAAARARAARRQRLRPARLPRRRPSGTARCRSPPCGPPARLGEAPRRLRAPGRSRRQLARRQAVATSSSRAWPSRSIFAASLYWTSPTRTMPPCSARPSARMSSQA